MATILDDDARIAVSSVLNRDTKQYGKKCMFDNDENTCWNSDQGGKQWIKVALGKKIDVTADNKLTLKIQFQGGFSCKLCTVSLLDTGNNTVASADCYPEDINSMQEFQLSFSTKDHQQCSFSNLQIDFRNSTDFFGRITVYYMDIVLQQC